MCPLTGGLCSLETQVDQFHDDTAEPSGIISKSDLLYRQAIGPPGSLLHAGSHEQARSLRPGPASLVKHTSKVRVSTAAKDAPVYSGYCTLMSSWTSPASAAVLKTSELQSW